MTVADFLEYADRIGVISLLLVAIIGGIRGWWVFGREHQESLKREQEWKELALTGTRLAEVSVPKAAARQDDRLEVILEALKAETLKRER